MNVRTTIILVAILALAVGYLAISQSGWLGKPQDQPKLEQEAQKLLPAMSEVNKLVVETPGVSKIVLVRQGKEWRLSEPVDAPATDYEVTSTVSVVSGLAYVRKYRPADADFPKDDLTRLAAPQKIVSLGDDKGASVTLKVGQNVPLKPRQLYVQLQGDPNVYVIEAGLNDALKKGLDSYRLAAVAKFDAVQAQRVEVRGDEHFQLIRSGGEWALDKPVAGRADQDKVRALLASISAVSAEKFVDDKPRDLAGYGLEQPALTVSVDLVEPTAATATPTTGAATQPQKMRTMTLAFGPPARGKVFAKLADQAWVFQTDESKLKDLQPKVADLRDKKVFDLAGKDVTRIQIDMLVAGKATLEKVDDQWRMKAPFEGMCEKEAVEQLLTSLRELKASEFVDNPTTLVAYGLEPPQGRITLDLRGSDKTFTVLVGKSSPSGQMGYTQGEAAKSVAVVSSAEFNTLCRPAAAYWSRALLVVPEDAGVTGVEITRPEGVFEVRLAKGSEYELVKPVQAPADGENVRALLTAARTLKPEKMISLDKALPANLREGKPLRLVLTYETPVPATATATATAPAAATAPTTSTAPATASAPTRPAMQSRRSGALLVWKDKTRTLVWMEGASPVAVGEMPADYYDKLSAELRDRVVVKLDADKATSFKMDVGETPLEMVKTSDGWRYTIDRHVKTDDAKVKAFLNELAGLKAKRFVEYGEQSDLARFGLDKPALVLEVKLEGGKLIQLKVGRTGPVGTDGLYAASSEVPGVFVLAPDTTSKFQKSAEDIRKAPAADVPPPPERP